MNKEQRLILQNVVFKEYKMGIDVNELCIKYDQKKTNVWWIKLIRTTPLTQA